MHLTLAVEPLPDERLELMFTCCHPSLAPEAQIALTLRTLSGLTTEEIARAFLVDPKTMAQRLVRAKRKIRSARIPYLVPTREHLAERLGAVISVLYLIFNEGYAASVGPLLLRTDLADEAIRLTRVLVDELPQAERPRALLALMLLHHARRAARVAADGEPVLLEEQDRTLWDAAQIKEGIELTDRLVREGGESDLTLEAVVNPFLLPQAAAQSAQRKGQRCLNRRSQPGGCASLSAAGEWASPVFVKYSTASSTADSESSFERRVRAR